MAKANSEGGINWDGSQRGADAVTVGRGYISADGDDNIVFNVGGTYTLKLVGGSIEITSDEVEEPEIEWITGDYYVVGKPDKFGAWGSCLKNNHIGKTNGEVEITVSAGDAIKVVKSNSTGGPDWDSNSALGASVVTKGRGYISADGDGNIVFNAAGTYTIKLVNGSKVEIYSDLEEPEVQIPATKVTLKFNDATITLAFDMPNWDPPAVNPYIYIASNSGAAIGASEPGTAMNGSEISVSANLADCKIIISFTQSGVKKQTKDIAASRFEDGGTYIISVGGDWDGDKFAAAIVEL